MASERQYFTLKMTISAALEEAGTTDADLRWSFIGLKKKFSLLKQNSSSPFSRLSSMKCDGDFCQSSHAVEAEYGPPRWKTSPAWDTQLRATQRIGRPMAYIHTVPQKWIQHLLCHKPSQWFQCYLEVALKVISQCDSVEIMLTWNIWTKAYKNIAPSAT